MVPNDKAYLSVSPQCHDSHFFSTVIPFGDILSVMRFYIVTHFSQINTSAKMAKWNEAAHLFLALSLFLSPSVPCKRLAAVQIKSKVICQIDGNLFLLIRFKCSRANGNHHWNVRQTWDMLYILTIFALPDWVLSLPSSFRPVLCNLDEMWRKKQTLWMDGDAVTNLGPKNCLKNLNFFRRTISVIKFMFYSMTNLLLFTNWN